MQKIFPPSIVFELGWTFGKFPTFLRSFFFGFCGRESKERCWISITPAWANLHHSLDCIGIDYNEFHKISHKKSPGITRAQLISLQFTCGPLITIQVNFEGGEKPSRSANALASGPAARSHRFLTGNERANSFARVWRRGDELCEEPDTLGFAKQNNALNSILSCKANCCLAHLQ